MTNATPDLPPMPEPDGIIVFGTQAMRGFIADTVCAYALQAVATRDARIETLEKAAKRVTDAFRKLGVAEFPRETYSAKHECEMAMLLLDSALSPTKEQQ